MDNEVKFEIISKEELDKFLEEYFECLEDFWKDKTIFIFDKEMKNNNDFIQISINDKLAGLAVIKNCEKNLELLHFTAKNFNFYDNILHKLKEFLTKNYNFEKIRIVYRNSSEIENFLEKNDFKKDNLNKDLEKVLCLYVYEKKQNK